MGCIEVMRLFGSGIPYFLADEGGKGVRGERGRKGKTRIGCINIHC